MNMYLVQCSSSSAWEAQEPGGLNTDQVQLFQALMTTRSPSATLRSSIRIASSRCGCSRGSPPEPAEVDRDLVASHPR